MVNRRSFFKKATALVSLAALPELVFSEELKAGINRVNNISPELVAQDEDFWNLIKESYTASATIINLNNGGVSPSPKVVQDALDRFNKMANEGPSYYMWQILDKGRESLRLKREMR